MTITEETIQYVAALAKLTLREEEKNQMAKDIKDFMGYIETMNEVDTDDVEPMSHVLPIQNVFREDVVIHMNDRDQILKNAPKQKDGFFAVPKTIE